MTDQLELSVLNRATEIARVQDQLEQFVATHHFPERKLHEVQVALEEHLTNIVDYGFDEAGEHPIGIGFKFTPPPELRIWVQEKAAHSTRWHIRLRTFRPPLSNGPSAGWAFT